MKNVPPPSKNTVEKYEAVCEKLKAIGAERGAMFGMPVLKRNGKAFAGLFGNAMVFKLAGESHAKALKLSGAELFDPSGMKRPMKAWVVVPTRYQGRWLGFAQVSFSEMDAGLRISSSRKMKSS